MGAVSSRARRWRLCQKELRETSRDRRTIVTLLLMPLLVYPLLSMALNRFLLTTGSSTEMVYRIGVETDAEGEILESLISNPASRPPAAVLKASGGDVADFAIFITSQRQEGP